ncbi:hypothetical protein D7030_14910 [Flavobacteriaceae bacterium AU392]|nr:hypothetical protein D1817_03580 [Flavobacteriaceae bacterium]RKM81587.1 hypothetical protein D7030_14910 [Flavobacteriaceae bacterium AU392]
MSNTITEPFTVGDWLIEPELLCISKSKEVRKLEFRTMEILLCLVSNQGEVVSKKKLLNEVWGEVYVTSNSLTRGISKLRKAFDDDPHNPKYIDTISKSGYRLVAPVKFNLDSNYNTQLGTLISPTTSDDKSRRWLWSLVAITVVLVFNLASVSFRDIYSEFYDPIPVSTLVGPERGLAISPDGKKISFSYVEPGTNNIDVYVKLLDDLSQIKFTNLETQQAYGIWSPDGNYMAYASVEDGNCGIYREPSFGGEKVRIGDCFQAPRDFVWSPDGKTIAFTDFKPRRQTRSIFFLDIETHVSEEILTTEKGISNKTPTFSSNGEYLFFNRTIDGQNGDIYKMRISDKELTRLTFDNSWILGLDIFDNGKQIAFSSNRGGPWAMWKMPISNGIITRFHINDRVPAYPRFSANGKRMVYKSIQDQIQLWTIEKEESGFKTPVQVASSTRTEIHPSLSNDGNKIVFISNRSGNFEVWSNNLKDNNLTKLTSLKGSFVNMPSWSRDGSEVVFDARINEDNAIYILDVASKLIRTFIDLKGDQVNARYSRDGKFIYFASNHSGTWQIWKKSVFDTNAAIEQITTNGGYHMQEGYNDGYLYYSRSDASGIWRLKEGDDKAEELFISNLSSIDWGSWVPVNDGILYINRDFGIQIYHQSYNTEKAPVSLFNPAKRIQLANPTLTATLDGSKIIFAQIENSEDEIMMVDFK